MQLPRIKLYLFLSLQMILLISAVRLTAADSVPEGCESLSPLTSACHGHGTCVATPRNGQLQHVCVCEDGYMSVGDFLSVHDTGARCLINTKVVRGLFATYCTAVCINLLLALRHLVLAYFAHHGILTAKLQDRAVSHPVTAYEVFHNLWGIPRIRLIAIILGWSIMHFVVCLLRLIDEPTFGSTMDASTQLASMDDLTPLPQLLKSGQMIGHTPAITILWALCSFIYFNSMLYASFQLLVAFQATAAAVSKDRSHHVQLLPSYTYWVLFPLSAISFLLMVIPLGEQSTMQPVVITFWCGVGVGCTGWALVYWRAAAALAKHVDDSTKATAELRHVTVVDDATHHHQHTTQSSSVDVFSQLSRRLRLTSVALPAQFIFLAGVQILVASWPLLRATSVYIMCISWTLGSVISVGIMFLFDVALQEDRRKARQISSVSPEIEATITHTPPPKSNTIANNSSSGPIGGHVQPELQTVVLDSAPNELH